MDTKKKLIDLNSTLYDLTEEYPELIPIFHDLGLVGASNSELRNSVGRTVKVSEGIQLLKLSLADVTARLVREGFIVNS